MEFTHDIATILDEDGVAIRAVIIAVNITVNLVYLHPQTSLRVYNSKDDLYKLNAYINKCKKIFNK